MRTAHQDTPYTRHTALYYIIHRTRLGCVFNSLHGRPRVFMTVIAKILYKTVSAARSSSLSFFPSRPRRTLYAHYTLAAGEPLAPQKPTLYTRILPNTAYICPFRYLFFFYFRFIFCSINVVSIFSRDRADHACGNSSSNFMFVHFRSSCFGIVYMYIYMRTRRGRVHT